MPGNHLGFWGLPLHAHHVSLPLTHWVLAHPPASISQMIHLPLLSPPVPCTGESAGLGQDRGVSATWQQEVLG